MLLFELFENTRGPKDTVVYAFGRFNPPNAGHQRLVNALKRKAGELNADWYLFISPRDSDPEKNPLTGAEKLAWWRAILPQDAKHFVMDPAIPMSDFAAEYLNKKGYKNAVVMYGAGEENMKFPMMTNGREVNSKGQPLRTIYNFETFTDGGSPESHDAQGIAGDPQLRSTDIRAMVSRGDRDAFFRATGVDPNLTVAGLDYFDTVAQAMSKGNK